MHSYLSGLVNLDRMVAGLPGSHLSLNVVVEGNGHGLGSWCMPLAKCDGCGRGTSRGWHNESNGPWHLDTGIDSG